jgi:NAD(P)-dependent dehydrogenase (short-subunit alcohol dehydrogenase family)
MTVTDGFQDFSAIVTGAGSGIGRATAEALARRGLRVALLDRNRELVDAVAEVITSVGGQAKPYKVDVSSSTQVERAFEKIARDIGPVSYLANIAGIDHAAPLEQISDQDWHNMFSVAVNGCFYCCRTVVPGMVARGYGSIVNMSSLHAMRGQANRVHYASSKAAIIGLTKSLAREKAENGIRVNAVAPGPIDTPLWRGNRSIKTLQSDMIERAKVIPLGRLGTAAEIAEAFVYLLSDHASYITGHVLTADGGESMP